MGSKDAGNEVAGGSKRRAGKKGPGRPSVPFRRRLKLRHLLFLLLVFSGIIPLVISSARMIEQNRDLLKTQEQVLLTSSAQRFARQLSEELSHHKDQLRQLGRGLLSMPGPETLGERLGQPWVEEYLRSFGDDHPEILAFRVSDQEGMGRILDQVEVPDPVDAVLTDALFEAIEAGAPVYRLVILSRQQDTGVVIAVPVLAGSETLVVEAMIPKSMSDSADIESEDLFLVDGAGKFLWSPGSKPEVEMALLDSEIVRDFARVPVSVTREYDLPIGGAPVKTLTRIVQVPETGWGVIAHKPSAQAFGEVRKMVVNAIISSVVLVVLALAFALVAARFFSQPIQHLAEASHEIAAGNFDRRVKTRGLAFEIADLADDFNRMSDTIENYIEQLKKAAEANRELFISTIRAFAAAIDAKDPYTRGHSERVATYSRAIARYLGLPKDVQERVWIAAVLHDVGKIGIEDRILKKMGVLTPEEFEQMKLHPVIGAEIVEPVAALREMVPGIRWHHEAWNGSGYPDKLKSEQIPLMARIIGVADTFDAITTTRPYQNAYSTDYALQTIKKLTGKKFDAKIVTAFLLAFEAGQIKVEKDEAKGPAKMRVPTAEVMAG